MELGDIGSMKKLGVTESYKLKWQVVNSASEAAEMIIRCVLFFLHLVCIIPTCTAELTISCARHHGGEKQFRRQEYDIYCNQCGLANPYLRGAVDRIVVCVFMSRPFEWQKMPSHRRSDPNEG